MPKLDWNARDDLQVHLLQLQSGLMEVQRHTDEGDLDQAIETLNSVQALAARTLDQLKRKVHPVLYGKGSPWS